MVNNLDLHKTSTAVVGCLFARTVKLTGQKFQGNLPCIWSALSPMSGGWRWANLRWTASPTRLRRGPSVPELLTLRGRVVTADAMHCRRQIAQQVAEQDGN